MLIEKLIKYLIEVNGNINSKNRVNNVFASWFQVITILQRLSHHLITKIFIQFNNNFSCSEPYLTNTKARFLWILLIHLAKVFHWIISRTFPFQDFETFGNRFFSGDCSRFPTHTSIISYL